MQQWVRDKGMWGARNSRPRQQEGLKGECLIQNGNCYTAPADLLPGENGGPTQSVHPVCFQRAKNTDFYMKLPNSVVHLNKMLHWPEDFLFLGDWCWSDKK